MHALQHFGDAAFDADGDQAASGFGHSAQQIRVFDDGIHPAHAVVFDLELFLLQPVTKLINPLGIYSEVIIMKPESIVSPANVILNI